MIFAIETSCDETSVAIINFEGKILSHIIVNQENHSKFGGVVPENASRAHLEILQIIIPHSLKEAKIKISDINNKKFNESNFANLSNDNSAKIEQIQLNSVKDDSRFDINSVKLIYALPVNSFTLISDNEQNIYLAKVVKSHQTNISKNSNEYKNYNDDANKIMKDNMYSSYDFLLNKKYKVKINQKTLERVKNYYR